MHPKTINVLKESSMVRALLALPLIVLALAFGGCGGERTETPTRGSITVIVSESVAPVIELEQQKFEELYPEAKVTLEVSTAREAIARLFNDTTKFIVSSRPLNDEEREVAKQAKIELHEYRIAIDAVAVIVNNDNPIGELRTTQLDSILSGDVRRWDQVGGNRANPIDVCLPTRNAGTYEAVATKLSQGNAFIAPAKLTDSSPETIEYVSGNSNAIGLLGMIWLARNKEKVKALRLSDPNAPDTLGTRGQYFSPHQAHVYQRAYPLTREVFIYAKPDPYTVVSGFISFITSAAGQKIILNSGLVPATMPVRLVELSARTPQT